MQGESCVNGSIIDELHSPDIQRDQVGDQKGVT